MTVWSNELEVAIRQALAGIQPMEQNREHLGRPFVTAYQLAIRVRALMPGLDMPVGGEGIGTQRTLTRYLATELSRRIRSEGDDCFVEGAQLSSAEVAVMSFRNPDGGDPIRNSNLVPRYDTTMFRLRG